MKVTIWKCKECSAILRERTHEICCENFPQGSTFVCGGELEIWGQSFELGNNGEPISNPNPELDEDQVELERLKEETK